MVFVRSKWVVQSRQKLTIREVIKHVVDTSMRLCGEMTLNDLVKELSTVIQQFWEHIAVKCIFHLMKADHGHGQLVDFSLELFHECNLFLVKLIISVQDRQLYYGLDEVLYNFLGFFLALGELPGCLIKFIQHFSTGVINQRCCNVFWWSHLAKNFLLCLDGQIFGTEKICRHFFGFIWLWAHCVRVNHWRPDYSWRAVWAEEAASQLLKKKKASMKRGKFCKFGQSQKGGPSRPQPLSAQKQHLQKSMHAALQSTHTVFLEVLDFFFLRGGVLLVTTRLNYRKELYWAMLYVHCVVKVTVIALLPRANKSSSIDVTRAQP